MLCINDSQHLPSSGHCQMLNINTHGCLLEFTALLNEIFLFLITMYTVALSCPFSLAAQKVPKAFAFLKCQFGSATKRGFGTSIQNKLWKFFCLFVCFSQQKQSDCQKSQGKRTLELSRCVFSKLGLYSLPKNATAGSVKPCAVYV